MDSRRHTKESSSLLPACKIMDNIFRSILTLDNVKLCYLGRHHRQVPLLLGALLLQLDILGPEERQVGAELLRLARHDCDL